MFPPQRDGDQHSSTESHAIEVDVDFELENAGENLFQPTGAPAPEVEQDTLVRSSTSPYTLEEATDTGSQPSSITPATGAVVVPPQREQEHLQSMELGLDDTEHRRNVTSSSMNPPEPDSATSPTSLESQDNQGKKNLFRKPIWLVVRAWRKVTLNINHCITSFAVTLSLKAARNPKATIGLITCVSVATLVTGLCTNFTVDVREDEMFAPFNSISREKRQYLDEIPGFPTPARPIYFMVHKDGDNAVGYEAMNRLFQAVDTVRALDGFDALCKQGNYTDRYTKERTCNILGPTRFWYNNATLFQEATGGSDDLTSATLSSSTFPGGVPVAHEFMMGKLEKDDKGLITFAKAILMAMQLPALGEDGEETAIFELVITDALAKLRDDWAMEPDNPYRLEFITIRSYPDELMRAIANDIPLVPFVFMIMTLFTMAVFWRKNKIQSRTALGAGAVFNIALSMSSGYGLAFILGIPFTSMTQMLPFLVFGVGLDDKFIIIGAYLRIDSRKDTVERVRETMEEVGVGISMTSITTVVAFMTGFISSIPSIKWLCLYAAPTIFIDFIYEVTFFVALLVLDERRIQANRRDCCCWIAVENNEDTIATRPRLKTEDDDSYQSAVQRKETPTMESNDDTIVQKKMQVAMEDRFMNWYADFLLQPNVKLLVLFGFTAFFVGCAYYATLLTQSFKAADFMPKGSFAASFLSSTDLYASATVRMPAYFRDVDQSDPEVQAQMLSFIDELVALPEFQKPPEFCWIRDFQRLKKGEFEEYADYAWIFNDETKTFNEQLQMALSISEVQEIFGVDIAFDAEGNIEASRCWLTATTLDLDVVEDQINIMQGMQRVMRNHPMNQGRDRLAFFTYDAIVFVWEFFGRAVAELMSTVSTGIIAVTIISFILIPHWTAILFVTPLITFLYIDMIGTLQFLGVRINPITYVCLVISIGFLVDFLMHVLLRYYESNRDTREEKVRDTLQTMGSSIFVGGSSTCLGVVPLAFSTSGILKTVFICFFSLVILGLAFGLILLPVLLSYFGPEVCVKPNHGELVHVLEPQMNDVQATSKRITEKTSSSASQSVSAEESSRGVGAESTSGVTMSQQHAVSGVSIQVDKSEVGLCSSIVTCAGARNDGSTVPLLPCDQEAQTPLASNNTGIAGPRPSQLATSTPDDNMPFDWASADLFVMHQSGSIEV